MNVMLVNGSLYGGGAEHVIATLARRLRSAGHNVTIAVIHGGGQVQRALAAEGFDVFSHLAEGTSGGLGTSRRLLKLINERHVDVAHSHDLRSLVDLALCRVGRKGFAHAHTFHFGNYPHISTKERLLESVFARVPDQLVAVGKRQRDALAKTLKMAPERIETVWNGVDCPSPRPTVAAGEDNHPVLVGSVSTLETQKGLPTLVEAAHLLRQGNIDFRLVVVGGGSKRAELDALVERLGLENCVEFTGWRADAATELLPKFDIFVQSSYWEAMSVVILEAMAARRTIVATTVGENSAVLEHERSAILVAPQDAEALANGLSRAIRDTALRRRLADAAHADYVARFTGSAMADRYIRIYESAAATCRTLA